MFFNNYSLRKYEPLYPITYKPIQTIIVPNKIIKYTLRQGVGDYPKPGSYINAHYSCHLTTGKQIANSKQSIVKFQIGYNRLIPALQIAFLKTKPKQKFRLIVAPQYGYQNNDNKTKIIPHKSKLIFTFQIQSIIQTRKNKSQNQIYAEAFYLLEKADLQIQKGNLMKSLQFLFDGYQILKKIKFPKTNIKQNILIKSIRILIYLEKIQEALSVINVLIDQEPSNLKAQQLKLQIYKKAQRQKDLSFAFKEFYEKYYQIKQNARFYVNFLKITNQQKELNNVRNYDIKKDQFIDQTKKLKAGKKKSKKNKEIKYNYN